jgi:hypothetical protein
MENGWFLKVLLEKLCLQESVLTTILILQHILLQHILQHILQHVQMHFLQAKAVSISDG